MRVYCWDPIVRYLGLVIPGYSNVKTKIEIFENYHDTSITGIEIIVLDLLW